MAKGNYGVNSLGGNEGKAGGNSGENGHSTKGKGKYSRIAGEFAKGDYLPGALEHGKGHSGKGVKSISDIAGNDKSTRNDIFTSFRKK